MSAGARRALAASCAIVAGATAALSQPPVGAWPLVFVAPALLLAAIAVEVRAAEVADRRPHVFRWGILAGVTRFGLLLPWLVAPAGVVGYVLLVVIQSVFMGLLALVVRPWIRSRWIVLVAAIAWTGMEAWRGSVPLGGFDWGALSYAHVQGSWMLPMARLLGARGLTFATVLVGAAGYDAGRRMHAATLGLSGRWRDHLRAGVPHAAPAFGILAGVLLASTLAIVEPPAPTGRTADVLVVQGNDIAERSARAGGIADRVIADNMRTLTIDAVGDGPRPDLTVWPESSVDRDPFTASGADMRDDVLAAARAVGGDLLVGTNLDGPTPGTWRNAAVLTDADGVPVARYAKRHLVPFGEYVPWRSALDWFPPLAQVPYDAIPGTGPQTIVTSKGTRLAVAICFETLFSGLVRDNVADLGTDAGLIVASTNDASYGRSAEPAQHLAQSRMRAVETGRWVVHAALSGASAFVDPNGRVHDATGLFTRATIRRQVPLVAGRTLFVTTGDLVGRVTRLLVLVLAAAAFVMAVRRRRTGPPSADHPLAPEPSR